MVESVCLVTAVRSRVERSAGCLRLRVGGVMAIGNMLVSKYAIIGKKFELEMTDWRSQKKRMKNEFKLNIDEFAEDMVMVLAIGG